MEIGNPLHDGNIFILWISTDRSALRICSLLQNNFESNWFCNSNEYNFRSERINQCGCPLGKLLVLRDTFISKKGGTRFLKSPLLNLSL